VVSATGPAAIPVKLGLGGDNQCQALGLRLVFVPKEGLPMTLANMRANDVRSLAVRCELCHHTPLAQLLSPPSLASSIEPQNSIEGMSEAD
jgi:hypothetical protein